MKQKSWLADVLTRFLWGAGRGWEFRKLWCRRRQFNETFSERNWNGNDGSRGRGGGGQSIAFNYEPVISRKITRHPLSVHYLIKELLALVSSFAAFIFPTNLTDPDYTNFPLPSIFQILTLSASSWYRLEFILARSCASEWRVYALKPVLLSERNRKWKKIRKKSTVKGFTQN